MSIVGDDGSRSRGSERVVCETLPFVEPPAPEAAASKQAFSLFISILSFNISPTFSAATSFRLLVKSTTCFEGSIAFFLTI